MSITTTRNQIRSIALLQIAEGYAWRERGRLSRSRKATPEEKEKARAIWQRALSIADARLYEVGQAHGSTLTGRSSELCPVREQLMRLVAWEVARNWPVSWPK